MAPGRLGVDSGAARGSSGRFELGSRTAKVGLGAVREAIEAVSGRLG